MKLVQEYRWEFSEEDNDQDSASKYIRDITESLSKSKINIHSRSVRRYADDYINYVKGSGPIRPISLIAIKYIEEEKNNKELWK